MAVIVEVKACRALSPEHEPQVLNHRRASGLPVALLLNFGPKPAIRRFAYDQTFPAAARSGHTTK